MNPIPSVGVCVTFCNMGVFYGKDFSVAMLKYLTGEPPVFGVFLLFAWYIHSYIPSMVTTCLCVVL